jgi:hypothetical protein
MCNEELMQEAGLDFEFSQIFALLGWTSFYNTSEKGSRLLTLEFLRTLKSSNNGVTFWLFCQEHTLSWRKCKESDARSLRGGGGELCNLKTLTYGFTIFAQR